MFQDQISITYFTQNTNIWKNMLIKTTRCSSRSQPLIQRKCLRTAPISKQCCYASFNLEKNFQELTTPSEMRGWEVHEMVQCANRYSAAHYWMYVEMGGIDVKEIAVINDAINALCLDQEKILFQPPSWCIFSLSSLYRVNKLIWDVDRKVNL